MRIKQTQPEIALLGFKLKLFALSRIIFIFLFQVLEELKDDNVNFTPPEVAD